MLKPKVGTNPKGKKFLKRRIGGLFLTYTLYGCQPTLPMDRVKIQLLPEEVKLVEEFEKELETLHTFLDPNLLCSKDAGFFESVAIILRQLRDEAIHICVVPHEVSQFDISVMHILLFMQKIKCKLFSFF